MNISDALPTSKESTASERLAALIADYKPLPGIPDEFIGPDGRPRDYWLRYLNSLTDLGADDIGRRFATADRHIHDSGVSYRSYGDTRERTLASLAFAPADRSE
ncbi:protein of unknown function [Methylocella tundrae]|uniref:Uncharacterized protein n=1 Tax=Methylocella tundrae TaxID=227605 RepID=A0A4U8Z1J3_METTU|nr:protein of unknown function [Methylocella tundrae]